jgi:hypothetical protein
MSPPSTALSTADLRAATPAHVSKKPEKRTSSSAGQSVMYLSEQARIAPSTAPSPSSSGKSGHLAYWPRGFEERRKSSEFTREPPTATDSPKQAPSQNRTNNNSQPQNNHKTQVHSHNRPREDPPRGGGAADVEEHAVAHGREGLNRTSIKAGDILRVIDDRAEVERLTKSTPGIAWNDAMVRWAFRTVLNHKSHSHECAVWMAHCGEIGPDSCIRMS